MGAVLQRVGYYREVTPKHMFEAFLADCENHLQAMFLLACTSAANLCFTLAYMQQCKLPDVASLVPAVIGVVGTDLFGKGVVAQNDEMLTTSAASIWAAFIIVATQNEAFSSESSALIGILVILGVLSVFVLISQNRVTDAIQHSFVFLVPFGAVVGYMFVMFDALRGTKCQHKLQIIGNGTIIPPITITVNDGSSYVMFLIFLGIFGALLALALLDTLARWSSVLGLPRAAFYAYSTLLFLFLMSIVVVIITTSSNASAVTLPTISSSATLILTTTSNTSAFFKGFSLLRRMLKFERAVQDVSDQRGFELARDGIVDGVRRYPVDLVMAALNITDEGWDKNLRAKELQPSSWRTEELLPRTRRCIPTEATAQNRAQFEGFIRNGVDTLCAIPPGPPPIDPTLFPSRLAANLLPRPATRPNILAAMDDIALAFLVESIKSAIKVAAGNHATQAPVGDDQTRRVRELDDLALVHIRHILSPMLSPDALNRIAQTISDAFPMSKSQVLQALQVNVNDLQASIVGDATLAANLSAPGGANSTQVWTRVVDIIRTVLDPIVRITDHQASDAAHDLVLRFVGPLPATSQLLWGIINNALDGVAQDISTSVPSSENSISFALRTSHSDIARIIIEGLTDAAVIRLVQVKDDYAKFSVIQH